VGITCKNPECVCVGGGVLKFRKKRGAHGKRVHKGNQGPVLWAWLENFFTPGRYQF